jgi:hypothetical protein
MFDTQEVINRRLLKQARAYRDSSVSSGLLVRFIVLVTMAVVVRVFCWDTIITIIDYFKSC